MSNKAIPAAAPSPCSGRSPTYVTVSAWAVPILIVGQFALVAALPVTLISYAVIMDRRSRALRWWGVALFALYAAPLIVWLSREDGAPSLSKDIHPVFVALITATALVILVTLYRNQRG